MKKRPFGVTVLAVLSVLLAIHAGLRVLQFLGILPFFFLGGEIIFRKFSLFSALMWGLMVWVYAWLTQMLLAIDKQAWLFLAVISVFNLVMEFLILVGGGTMTEVATPVILNTLVLIYMMLPGTRKAFGAN